MFHSIRNSPMWLLAGISLVAVIGFSVFDRYSPFFLLGAAGALFANVTGAGGGVVFIPAFQNLGLNELQSVGTSFAIQCFGMTTGALVWLRHARQESQHQRDWRLLVPFLAVSVPLSFAGLWLVYGLNIQAPGSLSLFFAWFSILLGTALFVTIYFKSKSHQIEALNHIGHRLDLLLLAIISFIGGVITAYLSVGVGEFVAFFLILRGYRVTVAVTVAVILSAATVWAGIGYHLNVGEIQYSVLLYAGPGAVIGAIIAKMVATRLPVLQLKLLFAGWVLLVGLVELISS